MVNSILFTVIYIAVLAAAVFFAFKKPWVKSLISLIINVLSFFAAFLASRYFVGLFGDSISEELKEEFLVALNLHSSVTVRDTAMLSVSKLAVTVLISISSFLILYFIFLLLLHAVKLAVFHLASGIKYREYDPEKKLGWLSAVISVLSFAVVSLAVLYPVGAASDIAVCAAENCDYELKSSVLTNPISRMYGLVGRGIFDKITEIEGNDNFVNSDEAELGSEIYISVLKVKEGKDYDGKSIDRIAGALKSSYIFTDFTSELVANAANSWRNGYKFMNKTVKIPEGRNGELVSDVLEILSNWQRENLIQDINTTINIYKLLQSNGIMKINDGAVLLEALGEEQFCEALFLELSGNDDFIAVIPKVMRFGIGSAVDAMKLEMNEDYIVEFNAKELTVEEWKQEAKAFSTLMKRMSAMSGDEKFDVMGFLSDLYELRSSKILSNMLLNLLIQILSNLLSGALG